MKLYQPRNKINYQTKENIWNNFKNLKLKKKKWKFKSLSNSFKTLNSEKKPKSLKYLYKKRLLTRQKFKNFYGFLKDTKLKKEYKKLKKKYIFSTIDNLSIHLEKKLDIILYRSKMVSSIFEAKQLISHKKVKVNNKIIYNPNYLLKKGDFIQISKESSNYNNSKMIIPPYISINSKFNLIIFLRNPNINEILYPFRYNSDFMFQYLNNK